MSNLKTSEIYNKLKKFKNFLGCFASDQLPTPNVPTYGFVVNLDPHDKPGSHWVAIYVSNGIGEYFDPFGLPPLSVEIIEFLEKYTKQATYVTTPIQSMTSRKCGGFCILYLYFKFHGKSTANFIWEFSNTLSENDIVIDLTL
jgi:hypothetical protein